MARTVKDDPLMKFKYRVSIPSLNAQMGFNKVSGMKFSTEVTDYDEGGFDHTHKLPGKSKVENVTFERGMTNSEVYNLCKKVLTDPNIRNSITIEVMDRYGNAVVTRYLHEAWACEWEGPDLDASSNDVAIEKITFAYEYDE